MIGATVHANQHIRRETVTRLNGCTVLATEWCVFEIWRAILVQPAVYTSALQLRHYMAARLRCVEAAESRAGLPEFFRGFDHGRLSKAYSFLILLRSSAASLTAVLPPVLLPLRKRPARWLTKAPRRVKSAASLARARVRFRGRTLRGSGD